MKLVTSKLECSYLLPHLLPDFRLFQDEPEYDLTEMRTNKVRNFNNCSLSTLLSLLGFPNCTAHLCFIESVQHVNLKKLTLAFKSTRCIAESLNASVIPCSLLFWLLYFFCLPSFLMVEKDIHTYTSLLESQPVTEGITRASQHDSPKHVMTPSRLPSLQCWLFAWSVIAVQLELCSSLTCICSFPYVC